MRHIYALIVILVMGSCGDGEPVEVAGNYSIAVTNRDNDCQFQNWTVGEMASGIQLVVTQEGSNVTAQVGGLVGGWMELVLGSRVYTGTVSGNNIELTLFGTRSATQGMCTYTVNSEVRADLDGDVLTGTIQYVPSTNGNPDCGVLNDCKTWQEFNGTRPPSN